MSDPSRPHGQHSSRPVVGVYLEYILFRDLLKISRVRKDMYNDTLNGSTEKKSAELPDAVGPIVQLQEKLYVPVKEYPDVSTYFN
ncbi:Protein quaking [Varanus komodoensis]|nr:Protein quaking [Varanus komodoensis]